MIFKKTFKGGVHPHDNKHFSNKKPIEKMPIPDKIILPLSQHTGTPCTPIVNIGDVVSIGQKIAESEAFVSSPIHATVSGKVIAIESYSHPVIPRPVDAIIIECNKTDQEKELFNTRNVWNKLNKEEIIKKIKEAGIVGMGGAAFPTHVKLSPSPKISIDSVILNGAECEPYLTADHRLMLEYPEDILEGLDIILHVMQIKNGYIGVEANKKDAIKLLNNIIEEKNITNIKVVPLKVKYPQGAEKQLIKAILNRRVPRGKLPFDVGVIVQNVATSKAIFDAVVFGKPLIERIVTVSGDGINEPKNLLVRIGTPISSVINYCGGSKGEISKIIMGGPMMGITQYNPDVPVIKGTNGILLFQSKKEPETTSCIRCGRCVNVCPMRLTPNQIADFVQKEMFDVCKDYGVLDCMECGACNYVCSAKLSLVHYFKYAKSQLMQKK